MPASPLTVGELGGALDAIGGFEACPFLAVAVSGGPDSLALAILADRWARHRGGRIWALTVDHRLRPESEAETRIVAAWLGSRGIGHTVLVWGGVKPTTGVQAAARIARYRLLAEWCTAHGCLHLLTAHHRADQAETFLIRRRAGSGVDGLAGMSVVRELSGVRLVRPVLGIEKSRLAALLDAEGQKFLCDPSNRNPAFERTRLRTRGANLAMAAALAEVAANGTSRVAREAALAGLLARAVTLHAAGFGILDRALILDKGGLGEQALGRVALTVGGGRYAPRLARLARLRAGLAAAPLRARTCGGCRFIPWRGRTLVVRELARAAPPTRLDPGRSVTWDRRFAADLPAEAHGPITLGYLGRAGVAALGHVPTAAGEPLPRLVYPFLPAFWDEAGLAGVPHLGYRRPTAGILPGLRFRPAHPLISAGFTVV